MWPRGKYVLGWYLDAVFSENVVISLSLVRNVWKWMATVDIYHLFICQKLLLNFTQKIVENAFDLMCQNLITVEEIIP